MTRPEGHRLQPQAQQTTIVKQVKTPLFRPSDPINSQPISPPELRVVCDTMLQGLCKKLRLHGVDAVALESHEYFENCARQVHMFGTYLKNHSSGTICQILAS